MTKNTIMKTFGNNSLSTYFYYLTKIGFWGAAGFLAFVLISMLIGFITYFFSIENGLVEVTIAEDFSLYIKPLKLFIKGEMGMPYFIPILVISTAIFYTVVLWFLQKMFKNFMELPIFKKDVVYSLKGLAYTFSVAAILSFCMMSFSPADGSDALLAIMLLFVITPLLFFIKAIFEEGVVVQEENELTI